MYKKIIIDSRVISHLGKDLITTSEVAVVELVKNCIDAKAQHVKLRLFDNVEKVPSNDILIRDFIPKEYRNLPLLIVEDDGKGMTTNELDSGFLKIGTDIKSDTHSFGEKGIGRLATQRLGKSVIVETSSESGNNTLCALLDWNKIISGNTDVPYYEFEKTSPHTKLWIFGVDLEDFLEDFLQMSLFENEKNISINRDLKSALNYLISPFQAEQNSASYPDIKISYNGIILKSDFPYNMVHLSESTHYFTI